MATYTLERTIQNVQDMLVITSGSNGSQTIDRNLPLLNPNYNPSDYEIRYTLVSGNAGNVAVNQASSWQNAVQTRAFKHRFVVDDAVGAGQYLDSLTVQVEARKISNPVDAISAPITSQLRLNLVEETPPQDPVWYGGNENFTVDMGVSLTLPNGTNANVITESWFLLNTNTNEIVIQIRPRWIPQGGGQSVPFQERDMRLFLVHPSKTLNDFDWRIRRKPGTDNGVALTGGNGRWEPMVPDTNWTEFLPPSGNYDFGDGAGNDAYYIQLDAGNGLTVTGTNAAEAANTTVEIEARYRANPALTKVFTFYIVGGITVNYGGSGGGSGGGGNGGGGWDPNPGGDMEER